MKKRAMITALATAILALSLAAPTRAELVRLYPEDFGAFRPEIVTVLNPILGLLPEITVPIAEAFLIDDFFCQSLDVTMEADIFLDISQTRFSLYWDTSGENDLVFQAEIDNWSFLGDFDLVGEDCIGFIDFEWQLFEGDMGASRTLLDMVLIPYWNTETGSLELHHKEHSGVPIYLVTLESFHLSLGLIWPLDILLEPWIEGWAHVAFQEIMAAALLAPGGLLFHVVEDTMTVLYTLHQELGCTVYYNASMPGKKISADQALADLGLCLLPALLIFGLKRRGRR